MNPNPNDITLNAQRIVETLQNANATLETQPPPEGEPAPKKPRKPRAKKPVPATTDTETTVTVIRKPLPPWAREAPAIAPVKGKVKEAPPATPAVEVPFAPARALRREYIRQTKRSLFRRAWSRVIAAGRMQIKQTGARQTKRAVDERKKDP